MTLTDQPDHRFCRKAGCLERAEDPDYIRDTPLCARHTRAVEDVVRRGIATRDTSR